MATKKTTKKTIKLTAKKKPVKKTASKAVVNKKVTKKKVAKKVKIAKRISKPTKKNSTKKPIKQASFIKQWWARRLEAFKLTYESEPESIWFGIIMIAAMILRLMQPDWYLNRQFHPDERWIAGVVSQLSYPGEPAGLQYGTFPMYVLAMIKDGVAAIASWFGPFDVNRFTIWGGRVLAGFFDLGTLIFTYLIGRRLLPGKTGRQVGLLAALFLTFTVLNIQMAHFFVVDVPLGFLVMGTLYWSVNIASSGRRVDYIWAGLFMGLAMATKTSAFPLAVSIGVGHLIGLNKAKASEQARRWQDFGLAIGISLIAFFVTMPHAILNWSKFWMNQQEQQRILVTGQADVPYNRQYLNTTPYLYYFRNLIQYTQGWGLGVSSILSFLILPLIALITAGRLLFLKQIPKLRKLINQERGLLIIFSFALVYFAIVGVSFAKFNRYMLPLTPVFSLIVARVFISIQQQLPKGWAAKLGQAIIALVLAGTILWALAFSSIYQKEHPWIAASRWIQETMAPGSTILNEEWGDDLPTHVPKLQAKKFKINKFSVQEPDSPRKRDQIINMLQVNDIVVMADTRAHAVYQRLGDRYPMNKAYYELMFEERLGYELAAEFKNYPSLFGKEFPDDEADESFTLYDHPHVYLFKRSSAALSANELEMRLDKRIEKIKKGISIPTKSTNKTGKKRIIKPDKKESLPTVINSNIGQSEGKPVFIFGQVNGFKAAIMWILVIEIIGLLTLPLCLSLFPRLPDSGMALSKIIGSLILAWTTWMLVSLGVVKHLQSTTLIVLLLLGTISIIWAKKRQLEIETFIKEKGKQWLVVEVIFLICFIGYMITKLYNPDINNPSGQGYNGGGEPMGISFFTAIYQSLHFPPYDPWLSGYHINYYYYGQLILGIMAKLTGVPPVWSYQITIALLFALTFTGIYGLGLALTGKKRWGVMAAIAGSMFGNMHSYIYMLEPLNRGINWNDMLNSISNLSKATMHHISRFEFIWNPTRLIKGTINEMPWFSFLYGDLHAHIIAIPYSLPIIGWGLNIIGPSNKTVTAMPEASGRTGTERGLSFFVTALTLGSLSAINTWNFPPYALLVLAVLITKALQDRKSKALPWAALREATFGWLRLVIGGLALLYFFHKNFTPQSTSLAFVNPAVRTNLQDFLIFFGASIFFMMTFFGQHLVESGKSLITYLGWKPKARKKWWVKTLNLLNTLWTKHPIAVYSLTSCIIGLGVLLLFNQVLLALLSVLVITILYVLIFKSLAPMLRMAMILTLLGFLIILGCEIVHIRDFMGVGGDMSRMNTVFKFYIIVWIYFALAGATFAAHFFNNQKAEKKLWRQLFENKKWMQVIGYCLAIILVMGMANFYQENTGTPWLTLLLFLAIIIVPIVWMMRPKDPNWRLAWVTVMGFILFTVSLYPPISLYNRMRLCSGFNHPTLNGIAYLDRLLAKEAKAIKWINANINQMDIILEAPGKRGYNCFDTRIAIFTGHPSLIGWVGQEEQMRYNSQLTGSRTRDADKIFNTLNIEEAKKLIKHYQIEYVFVGQNERQAYSLQGLEKFHRFMDVVYDQEGIKIYKNR